MGPAGPHPTQRGHSSKQTSRKDTERMRSCPEVRGAGKAQESASWPLHKRQSHLQRPPGVTPPATAFFGSSSKYASCQGTRLCGSPGHGDPSSRPDTRPRRGPPRTWGAWCTGRVACSPESHHGSRTLFPAPGALLKEQCPPKLPWRPGRRPCGHRRTPQSRKRRRLLPAAGHAPQSQWP